jgi:signal transduction histidine kinase
VLRANREWLRATGIAHDRVAGADVHELRNPLAPIRNSIYLLERSAPESEHAARAREVIRRQTEHLTRSGETRRSAPRA